jgi:arylsulfatase A-like enzyme
VICGVPLRAWLRVAAAALALAGAAGCTRPAADNVLLISFDTTRADHLSAYGYPRVTSPSIDSLAKRGTLFTRAYSHVPSTLPSHSTMFTGLLPPQHGVRCNGKYRLPASRTTLAEILANAGFATGAVVGAFPLAARFGIAQGFATYDDDFASSALTAKRRKGRMDDPGFWIGHEFVDFERGADEVTDRAVAWLEGRKPRWFLFAHYFDPHWPYEPADDWRPMYESPYDAEIAYADAHLGRLLDKVATMPGRTLIVFTADHGEGLGDHGEAMHNRFLYDATMRVPLVIALEGAVLPNRRVESLVGHVDLLPTVLELLGVAAPKGLAGHSLVPLLAGGTEPERPLYAETLVPALERPLGIEVRAWMETPYKLIHTETPAGDRVELYDFVADPAELTDLSRSHEVLAAQMAARLAAERERLERSAPAPESIVVDPATEARLKSLGYL